MLESHEACSERQTGPAYNAAALATLGLDRLQARTARVAIGFVDYGFDLLHPSLIDPASRGSRFRHLWDQNATPEAITAVVDLQDVADWGPDALDLAVASAVASGSRRELDATYDPHANNCGRHGTTGGAHGTLMASIAAGNAVSGFIGAAPKAQLIGVQLALLDHHWKEQDGDGRPTWLGWNLSEQPLWTGWRSYDEAPQIINAVHYIYDRARRLGVDALVINLSIGAWAGGHDGSSPVETAIANLIAKADAAFAAGEGPRTIVVAGAGNAGVDDGHWRASLEPGQRVDFEWVTQRRDPTQNKLDIWYRRTTEPISVEVRLPGMPPIAVAPGGTCSLEVDGMRIGIAEHTPGLRPGLSCVRLLVHPPLLPAYLFDAHGNGDTLAVTIELCSREAASVHAWIERDDGGAERSWLSPSHAESSLCCLATTPGVIVVGGYDHHVTEPGDAPAILALSSLGPAPWNDTVAGRLPHVCAPAHRIWGARSKTRGFTETTGTSAAVALASGAIARFLTAHGAAAVIPMPAQPWSPRRGLGPLTFDVVKRTGAEP